MVDGVIFYLADQSEYKGIEVMALDSATNEAIVMAVDQRKAEYEQRFSKWGSANDAFKLWSERIVTLIDDSHGIKREYKK